MAQVEAAVGVTQVQSESPAGSIDGSNVTFTLAHTPAAGPLMLFLHGKFLDPGEDYALSGAVVTMTFAPEEGKLRARYQYWQSSGRMAAWINWRTNPMGGASTESETVAP